MIPHSRENPQAKYVFLLSNSIDSARGRQAFLTNKDMEMRGVDIVLRILRMDKNFDGRVRKRGIGLLAQS